MRRPCALRRRASLVTSCPRADATTTARRRAGDGGVAAPAPRAAPNQCIVAGSASRRTPGQSVVGTPPLRHAASHQATVGRAAPSHTLPQRVVRSHRTTTGVHHRATPCTNAAPRTNASYGRRGTSSASWHASRQRVVRSQGTTTGLHHHATPCANPSCGRTGRGTLRARATRMHRRGYGRGGPDGRRMRRPCALRRRASLVTSCLRGDVISTARGHALHRGTRSTNASCAAAMARRARMRHAGLRWSAHAALPHHRTPCTHASCGVSGRWATHASPLRRPGTSCLPCDIARPCDVAPAT